MDALQALRSLEGRQVFDCIFMDPPYEKGLERQVLEYLAESTLADEHTLIIAEADLHTDFPMWKKSVMRSAAPRNIKPTSMFFCTKESENTHGNSSLSGKL